MSDHPSHVIKKRTMIKDRVGCCRSSTYSLPAEGHIYGMKSPEQLEGAGNTSAMRQYNLEHPNIRMKEALQSSSTRIDANHEGPFGIKSKFSEDPMDTILQGKFTNYNHEDRDYPSVQSIKKVGYLPDPRPTVASLAVIHAREKKEEQAKPKHFIMKKFQNVKGKMQTEREFAASQNNEEPTSYE